MLTEEVLMNIIKNYTIFPNDANKAISNPFIEFRDTFETTSGEVKYFDDMMIDDGRIYAIVGPSGSGKSTFIANLYNSGALGSSESQFIPYLNRQIFNERFPNEKDKVYLKYEKAKKEHLAKNHKSFLLESANFDESYVEFLVKMHEEYGSKINIIYITTQSMFENVKRVENRKTSEGGFGLKTRELNHDHVTGQLEMDAAAVRKLAFISENLYVLDNSMRKPQLLGKKIGNNGEFQEAKCDIMRRKLAKSIFPISKYPVFKNRSITATKKIYKSIKLNNKPIFQTIFGDKRKVNESVMQEVAATIMPESNIVDENPVLIEQALTEIKQKRKEEKAFNITNSLIGKRILSPEQQQLQLTRKFIEVLNKEKK